VADDLSTPLGQHTKRKSWKRPIRLPVAIAGLLALCLGLFVIWAAVVDDPYGGEPVAVVAINNAHAAPVRKPDEAKAEPKVEPKTDPKAEPKTPAPGTADSRQATAEPPKVPPAGMQSVTIINGSSGQRQEVLVPAHGGQQLALADPKLLEQTRHGSVPRVSLDGARPLAAYARPVRETSANANMPRIAIVITGLGIGARTTEEAITQLPGPVTLAFAPYGTDLERVAARARADGHELLLQLPMEPFDYPDNDPGPQTLLTSLAPEQNVDRMHWLMSRFQGYVGVANYMGSRFTASDAAFAPVLREVAKRGLMYLDDGSSPRSLASQIAGANNLPFAKAGIVLDAVPTPNEIERALARLEAMARENGSAVGVASALPVSLARIAKWAKGAEARGFLLVPISAAVARKAS
jgi:polysaccharide deacetylase 2 family uncharacterized protein YibQ